MNGTYDYRLFVDCGAPSLYNKLSRKTNTRGRMGSTFEERKFDDYSYVETAEYKKYREGYIKFLLENRDEFEAYSNLDVINNPKLTYRNQKIIEEAGLRPIPVWHLGSDPKWLRKYVKTYDYIAIGGLVPNTKQALRPLLSHLFREHLLDSNGFPKVKLHGFACTAFDLMLEYPWYSVDSASAMKLGVYGRLYLPSYDRKLHIVPVSTRDTPLQWQQTPLHIKEIEKRIEYYGFGSIDTLCESTPDRGAWNYLIYLEMLENYALPWPWSMDKRPTPRKEGGNNTHVRFYFAGTASKAYEKNLWDRVAHAGIDSARKYRLASFFYKSAAVHNIALRKEEQEKRRSNEDIQRKAPKRVGNCKARSSK